VATDFAEWGGAPAGRAAPASANQALIADLAGANRRPRLFALCGGSQALFEVAKKVGLNATYHEAPGAHFWFIRRQCLSEFGFLIFK
jgi:hypothetical protein